MERFKKNEPRSRRGRLLKVADPIVRRGESEDEPKGLFKTIGDARGALAARQEPAGFWVFDLEADVTIPAEYLILQRFLQRDIDKGLRERLTCYIRRKQLPDGGWPLYEGGFSDISATVKGYFALKLSGDSPDAEHMVRAKQLILSLGGAAHVNVFTRIMLALYGQIPWRTVPAIPVQIMLLPRWFFFHIDKVSYWSRTVIVTLLIFCSRRTVCKLRPEEGLPELFVSSPESIRHIDKYVSGRMRKNFLIFIDRLLKKGNRLIAPLWREKATKLAESFILEKMSCENGIGAIFPPMVNCLVTLHVLGYSKDHPHMARGIKALDDLLLDRGDESFCQPCFSPVWDTCLALAAMEESAAGAGGWQGRESAIKWLLERQIKVSGDWSCNAPFLEPGGWAFQFENDFYPDTDDTAMVVMALLRAGVMDKEEYMEPLGKAVNWILGMQNKDGSWGAFDIDNNYTYLNDIPFADHGALLDPGTSDVTGRCVEALSMLGYRRDFPPVARAIEFLRSEQEECGAWFGRWGVNYIYGTWSVLVALKQAGEDMSLPYIKKAAQWLRSVQNVDGGWGETCYSYSNAALAGMGESTPSQTAWAIMALMSVLGWDDEAVRRGVDYLKKNQRSDGEWDEKFYTGTGFPRVFFLKYHGYRLYFPLWALGVYDRLKAGKLTREDEAALQRPPQWDLPVLKKEGL